MFDAVETGGWQVYRGTMEGKVRGQNSSSFQSANHLLAVCKGTTRTMRIIDCQVAGIYSAAASPDVECPLARATTMLALFPFLNFAV